MIKYKNFFISLLVVAFIFQVSKFYSFYDEYSDWQYADWIINYQGGFIRRGLVGELLFKVHTFSLINLDILVLCFVACSGQDEPNIPVIGSPSIFNSDTISKF